VDRCNKELVQQVVEDSALASWHSSRNDAERRTLDLLQGEHESGVFGVGKKQQQQIFS
jgi:hypothetical protein